MPTAPPTDPLVSTPAASPTLSSTATAPTATPVPFGIQLEPPSPPQGQPFVVVVSGLQVGEPVALTYFGLDAGHARPISGTADGRGQFRLNLADGVRDATCFTAQRNDGSTNSVSAGATGICADAVAAFSGPSPKLVGPNQYFTIYVNLPVGTQITFIGLAGPDGRLIAHRAGGFGWQRPVTEQPTSHIHRFSPEYEGAAALPAGDYTWTYEVLGRRYDFKVTLAR